MYQDWNKLIIDLKSYYSKLKNTAEYKEKCKKVLMNLIKNGFPMVKNLMN